MTIRKYPIPLGVGSFSLEMPRGSLILDLQMQRGQPCFWALVRPGEEPVERRFVVVGTGWPLAPEFSALVHRGTFQMLDGRFVWHVFENPRADTPV